MIDIWSCDNGLTFLLPEERLTKYFVKNADQWNKNYSYIWWNGRCLGLSVAFTVHGQKVGV